MPDHSFDILVVGGGVIGSSVAHFLSANPEGTSLRVGVVEPDPTSVLVADFFLTQLLLLL